MQVWRLVRASRLEDAWSGEGARRFGGRWNSRGVALVYAASSLELALLEHLVHLDVELLPRDLHALCADIPDETLRGPPERLPSGWDRPPPYRPPVQAVGDRWARARESLALRVPASVLPRRFNVLINPAHPDIGRLRVLSQEPLPWPGRLIDYLQSLRK